MTREVFEKAIRVYDELNNLIKFRQEIQTEATRNLSFVIAKDPMKRIIEPLDQKVIALAGDIIKKHERMIRKEVDDRIKELEAEIEKL